MALSLRLLLIQGLALAAWLTASISVICEGAVPLSETVCSNSSGVGHYFNSSTNSCSPCTDCSSLGLSEVRNCSNNEDSLCSCPTAGHYRDPTDRSCRPCTDCIARRLIPADNCTATRDSVCNSCRNGFYYSNHNKKCTLDCSSCPLGRCRQDSPDHCECRACKTGQFCTERDQSPACQIVSSSSVPIVIPTLSNSGDTQSFSAVSSALIAVGAVMTIVIFSACFVLLGVATTCRRNENPSEVSSDGSGRGRVNARSFNVITSASLASLYMNGHSPSPSQEYRTSLDILKYSNSSLYSNSWNTLRSTGSPKTGRSNSVPLV